MADRDSKEIVKRIVNAIEHPDNPSRNKAIKAFETKERKQQQNDIVLSLVFQSIFLVFSLAVLIYVWAQNSTVSNRWVSLIFGTIAGIAFCVTAERRKSLSNKPLSPVFTLIGSVLIVSISLFIAYIKSFLSPFVTVWTTIFLASFFVIVLGYIVSVYYQKIREGFRQKM